jgi:hypothetical protein
MLLSLQGTVDGFTAPFPAAPSLSAAPRGAPWPIETVFYRPLGQPTISPGGVGSARLQRMLLSSPSATSPFILSRGLARRDPTSAPWPSGAAGPDAGCQLGAIEDSELAVVGDDS